MSAENHYLDAIEFLDNGDRESALQEANKAVKLDPEHVEAWQVISDAHLDKSGKPADLMSASKCLSAVTKIVELDPTRIDMWVRGGRLLADELGLMFDALEWWQKVRHHAPYEVTPLIEQATIMADLGLYHDGRERIETILNEDMDVATSQYGRVHQLLGLFNNAIQQDTSQHFKPWEKRHLGWAAIEAKMKKAPVSETTIFMLVTVPILFAVVVLSNFLAGDGFAAFCLTSVVIFIAVMAGMRFTKNMFRSINRPAFNLLRAMNFESSTGFSVISEEMKTSVLYMYILQRKPIAWQERMLLIIEEKNELPKNWQIELPDFESHLDELGYIDEGGEDNEESAELFWEATEGEPNSSDSSES